VWNSFLSGGGKTKTLRMENGVVSSHKFDPPIIWWGYAGHPEGRSHKSVTTCSKSFRGKGNKKTLEEDFKAESAVMGLGFCDAKHGDKYITHSMLAIRCGFG